MIVWVAGGAVLGIRGRAAPGRPHAGQPGAAGEQLRHLRGLADGLPGHLRIARCAAAFPSGRSMRASCLLFRFARLLCAELRTISQSARHDDLGALYLAALVPPSCLHISFMADARPHAMAELAKRPDGLQMRLRRAPLPPASASSNNGKGCGVDRRAPRCCAGCAGCCSTGDSPLRQNAVAGPGRASVAGCFYDPLVSSLFCPLLTARDMRASGGRRLLRRWLCRPLRDLAQHRRAPGCRGGAGRAPGPGGAAARGPAPAGRPRARAGPGACMTQQDRLLDLPVHEASQVGPAACETAPTSCMSSERAASEV